MSDQESYFYKYRTIDDRYIDRARRIFTHNELYFSSKDQFNDPFDCKFGYSFAASDEKSEIIFRDCLSKDVRLTIEEKDGAGWRKVRIKLIRLNGTIPNL